MAHWNAGTGDGGWDNPAPAAAFGGGGDADFGGDGVTDFGGGGGGGGGGACYNCGQEGHNKTDCPEPLQASSGECRICKKEGHYAKECPEAGPQRCGNCRREGHYIDECPDPLVCPRCKGCHKLRDCVEPMMCYHCNEEGHMGRDCPTYVAKCKNCGQEGHGAANCENARNIDRNHLPDFSGEEAWKMLETSIIERDIDDIKEKVQIYVKAQPETTFVELEKALRSQGYGLYLIPLERANLAITMTNMDLQGNLDKKYTVNYRLSNMPRRATEKEGWPMSDDEVLERLADAGDVVPRGVPKCSRCGELGHTTRDCEQEEMESERAVVKCFNCEEVGHRVRDCPIPRVDRFACKNCGKPGHKVVDCEEPRSAVNVECHKCNEMGHFSKDCPKGGPKGCRNCGEEGHMSKECTNEKNMAIQQCRNCDEMGHESRGCPKPRDYSRIKCQNCEQMGHTKVRCPKPRVEEDAGGYAAPEAEVETATFDAGGGGGW